MGTKALNAKEQATLDAFPDPHVPVILEDLARATYPKKGVRSRSQGNSWARNSLRALVKLGLVEQVGRGLYQRTEVDYREAASA
jgi:hypothetical protein